MQTLEDVFNDLKPGNILLSQTHSDWNGTEYTTIEDMRLFTVVAIDIWDMAIAVGVVDLCRFDCDTLRHTNQPMLTIEWLVEWSDLIHVIGLWKMVPTITEVKQAIRAHRQSV